MNSDLFSALVAFLVPIPLVAVALWLLRLRGIKPLNLLTTDEWLASGKLIAATGLLLFLLWRMIYSELPQELFIYGRF